MKTSGMVVELKTALTEKKIAYKNHPKIWRPFCQRQRCCTYVPVCDVILKGVYTSAM